MKGFNDSTKMQAGHNFVRTAIPVKTHQRAVPVRKTMDMPPSPTMRLAKGGEVDDSGGALSDTAQFTKNKGAIYTRLTGKQPDPNKGIMDQVDDAMRSATARGKLSPENAQKYRDQFWNDDPGPAKSKPAPLNKARGGRIKVASRTPLIKGC